jgi:hypothetical protein
MRYEDFTLLLTGAREVGEANARIRAHRIALRSRKGAPALGMSGTGSASCDMVQCALATAMGEPGIEIVILAALHQRRNPATWPKRLRPDFRI